jgi:hypothetical protein
VSFILVVYNLAYFRAPYHFREYDSANRLVLQALPLLLLYLSLRFAQIEGGAEIFSYTRFSSGAIFPKLLRAVGRVSNDQQVLPRQESD